MLNSYLDKARELLRSEAEAIAGLEKLSTPISAKRWMFYSTPKAK